MSKEDPGIAKFMVETWGLQSPSDIADLYKAPALKPEVTRIKLLAKGEPEEFVEELFRLESGAYSGDFSCEGARMCHWLRQARRPAGRRYEMQKLDVEQHTELHQWPTGIESIDRLTGGGYGMTVFGGTPKLGKSLAALGAAIATALKGWPVLYVNAELTAPQNYKRVMARCGGDIPENLIENLVIMNTQPGCSMDEVLEQAQTHIGWDETYFLVVLDSINRLAGMDREENVDPSYWGKLRAWTEWAMQSAKISNGRVSFLVVSELNKQNGFKGGDIEYAADMLVRFTRDVEPDCVLIEVSDSRSTRSGDLGNHRRDWTRGEFRQLRTGDPT